MMMRECADLRYALEQLSQKKGDVLAGGTDWYPALQGAVPPATVVNVKRIESLQSIIDEPDGWRIGAAVTWSALIRTNLPPVFDALKAAGREVGSIQIQNSATLAGNLCNASPAADGVPPLLALDARVELTSLAGSRELSLERFLLGVRQTACAADELVTAIRVPHWNGSSISRFSKLGSRTYLLISIAMLAVTLELDAHGRISQARVAVGSCSPVAVRLERLEAELTGRQISESTLCELCTAEHLESLSPIDDVRATAAYRLLAVEELLRRVIAELQQQWQESH